MRYSRLFLGILIIAFSLWIIMGEQITGASSDAVVNARLSTVRAPIAGTIDMPFRPFGTKVDENESLATISDPLVDVIHLNDLEMERDFVRADIARVTRDIETTADQLDAMVKRVDIYAAHRTDEIDTRLRRANERVDILMQVSRATDPADFPAIAASSIELSRALEEAETLRIARDAISYEVYLGDGYNDAPATEIQHIAAVADQARRTTDLESLQARLAALDTRITRERQRTNLLGAASLNAPLNAVVWEVLSGDGEVVQRGQDVMKLMNCGSALVTLSVPDAVYNRLRIGQIATFRLDGDSTVFDGTITRMAGSGASTIYRNLAITPSTKHLERYDVSLLVPDLRAMSDQNCTVGQTGRVFFDTRPLDWLRDLFN